MSAGQLRADARRVASFPSDVTRRSVRVLADAIRPRVRVDTGGDMRLSGMRDPTPIRVTETVTATGSTASGAVTFGPPAMRPAVTWLNDGTRPHAETDHPGTPARYTVDEPVADTLPVVMRLVDDRLAVALP